MILFVSGSTRTVRECADRYPDHLGCMVTPNNRNGMQALVNVGLPWVADNGAFKGFDPDKFRSFLRKIAFYPRCQFVVCPDKVADAKTTLEMFSEWALEVRATGQPLALVGQDGLESLSVPWDCFDAFFIGGSTEWKLGEAAAQLSAEAKRRGKWLHMGRVNSLRRMVHAQMIGCDSVDGSSASMFGDKYIHKFCKWMKCLGQQRMMFQ